MVLLAGPGDSSDIVADYLASRVHDLIVVTEKAQSRIRLARRRARRVGWSTVAGQVLFVSCLQPVLRWSGRRRRRTILGQTIPGTGAANVIRPDLRHAVTSVNGDETVALLESLGPDVVVVHGTRIIASRVLTSARCPVVNMHAGITPRYRGVHGGYWALAEGHPEWVGTTVHLVDPGIDTGGILAQTTFDVGVDDTIATYPELHLVYGLPLLGNQIDKAVAGEKLEPLPSGLAPGSRLHYHPTIWGYLWHRWRDGVR